MKKLRSPRVLNGVGLLLLMFSLGLALVTLFKGWRHEQPPRSAEVLARRTLPQSPSEVVADYWELSLKGDLQAAGMRRAIARDNRTGLIKLETVERDDWSAVIHQRELRLAGVEREVIETDGSAVVIVRVTSHRSAYLPTMKHVLKKLEGEWKITDIY